MLNGSLLNETTFNGTRTRFPVYKLGNFSFKQWGYVSKIMSTPFNLAVLVFQKVRVFIDSPKIKIRTKQKHF
jgi:hypothetical protein